MNQRSRGTAFVVGAFLAPAFLVAGCSSQKMLFQSEVETQSQAALTATIGQQAPAISCPGDLEAKVGATETCAVTINNSVFDVTVTVTSFDDTNDNANFDVQVADAPRT